MLRISYTGTFVLWSFALFWIIKLIQYVVDIQRLLELQNFYHYLLEIREVQQD
jgi:autophagy-related protein 9